MVISESSVHQEVFNDLSLAARQKIDIWMFPASPWLDPQRQWRRMHILTLHGKRISETMRWDDSYSHGSEAEWPSPLHSTQIKLKGGVQLLHTGKNLIGPEAQVSKQVFKFSINKRKGWRGKKRENLSRIYREECRFLLSKSRYTHGNQKLSGQPHRWGPCLPAWVECAGVSKWAPLG